MGWWLVFLFFLDWSDNRFVDEPKHLKCASCDSRFKSAWALLCHLTEFHRMKLYKTEEKIEEAQVKNVSLCTEVAML